MIITGLTHNYTPGEIKEELDSKLNIMDAKNPQSQILSVNYIGKKYTSKSNGLRCLVRVTFSTFSGAVQCIRQSKDLKGDPDWGIVINPDRSPTEQNEIKKLVAEMKTKIASDPSVFWKISKMKLVSFEKSDNNSMECFER